MTNKLENEVQRLRILFNLHGSIMEIINSGVPLNSTLQLSLEEICKVTTGSNTAIFLPNESDELEIVAATGDYGHELKEKAKYKEKGIVRWVYDNNDSVYEPDFNNVDWKTRKYKPALIDLYPKEMNSVLVIPLASPSGKYGVLELFSSNKEAFDGETLDSLFITSSTLAQTIQNVKLREIEARMREELINSKERERNHLIDLLGLTYHAVEKESILKDHSAEVAGLSKGFAAYLGYDKDYQNKIYLGARIHDVGKLEIAGWFKGKHSRKRYKKPELPEIIKSHAIRGHGILKEYHIRDIFYQNIVRDHHQRWDGAGYPANGKPLKGDEISTEAQIVGLADTYNALISERPYRQKNFLGLGLIWYGPKAFTKEQALQIIEQGSGTHFNPVLGKKFIEFVKKTT